MEWWWLDHRDEVDRRKPRGIGVQRHLYKTPYKQYVGKLRIDDDPRRSTAQLVKGIVYVWDGIDCVESGA